MRKIYTDRLVLRPFKENDAEAMYRNWTFDERVAKYCRWYPHKDISKTEYCWAITLKEKDEPIGCVDLVGINSVGVPEIGYVLAYDYWGSGIMTEAVRAHYPKGMLYGCSEWTVGMEVYMQYKYMRIQGREASWITKYPKGTLWERLFMRINGRLLYGLRMVKWCKIVI